MGILLFTLPEYVSLVLAKLWTNPGKAPEHSNNADAVQEHRGRTRGVRQVGVVLGSRTL